MKRLDFFEYPSGLEELLRVADIDSHLRALIFPSLLVRSLLVVPIRHEGVGVGAIYLTHETGGGEFSREGEEAPRNIRLPSGIGNRQRLQAPGIA